MARVEKKEVWYQGKLHSLGPEQFFIMKHDGLYWRLGFYFFTSHYLYKTYATILFGEICVCIFYNVI